MQALLNAFGSIREFIELGGDVLYYIMFVVFLMWMFIVERIWFLYFVAPGRLRGAVKNWDERSDTTSWYAKQVRMLIISEVDNDVHKNLFMIKTLIALCPLLGLLGTVTGMISVFDVMAISGTGNARAMAAGVSKATVPTMAGMVAALSGVFFSTQLQSRADAQVDLLEDNLQRH
ncbi:MAG: MotA/TolQ/ExbB proton channel family protein [bacterium]